MKKWVISCNVFYLNNLRMISSKDTSEAGFLEKRLTLFRSDEHQYSSDCVDELYSEITAAGNFRTEVKTVRFLGLRNTIFGGLRRLTKWMKISLPIFHSQKINFSAQLGPDFKICIPEYLFTKNNFIYMFDAWPRFHQWMALMFDLLNVKAVFFSSREVHRLYQLNTRSSCKSYWIPEGIQASAYHFAAEKKVDVLEFGRKYQRYHDLIVGGLANTGKVHVYLKDNENILYKTKEEFAAGLADAKISICIPSNITHPERSEHISTMTLRYLQCMASKCLIVGVLPDEMVEVFGYMPIVPIDFDAAEEQILDILANYDDYTALIEKNYQEVLDKHQWSNRWATMEGIVNSFTGV